MKLKPTMIPLAAAVLLLGCSPSDQSSAPPESSPTVELVKEKARVAADTTKNQLAVSRDEFVATMNKKLAEFDTRIAELASKSESYKVDAKVQADQALTALKEQRGKLNEKFEAFKLASADTWQHLQAGLATAVDELEKAYDNAKVRFN